MTTTTNELVDAALRYAALGYPVFPCWPGSKKPIPEHGFHNATVDTAQIERWWSEQPHANVAIATEGLVVIDPDGAENPWPENGFSLDDAASPMAQTPRGGTHRWFRQPSGKRWRSHQSQLAPNVDTKANGGYVMVAPSVFQSFGPYRWFPGRELECPPAELPEPPGWLAEMLDRLEERPATITSSVIPGVDSNLIAEGCRNQTLARLAGGMRRNGMSEGEIAAALHRVNLDRCVPSLPLEEVDRIAVSVARYEPDSVAVAIMEHHWDQLQADPRGNDEPPDEDPGPIPERLLHVPGFISSVMNYTLSTAPYPEPVLAFAGALSLQALLAGRKVRDPEDNRTSLYLLSLANSGVGKDYPRKVNQRILLAAGMTDALGDMFASGEGIEDRMLTHRSVLFQTDEIDSLMAKINQGKDARHDGIMTVLLKMYTSTNSVYPLRTKVGRPHAVIDQPNLCIFGTAIPQHFYEAFSVKMLTNGFFARMLVLETGKRGAGQDAQARPLPQEVVDIAKWWVAFAPGGDTKTHAPVVVPQTDEAVKILRELRELADRQYSVAETNLDQVGMALWARASEKARRLALIYASSANHTQLEINAEAARWACDFADHQTRRMLWMAAAHVAENEHDARCKKLVATLRRWREKRGDDWMPYWRISRQHRWSEREHDEVRTTLLNQRMIEYTTVTTNGRPQRIYRLA